MKYEKLSMTGLYRFFTDITNAIFSYDYIVDWDSCERASRKLLFRRMRTMMLNDKKLPKEKLDQLESKLLSQSCTEGMRLTTCFRVITKEWHQIARFKPICLSDKEFFVSTVFHYFLQCRFDGANV